MKKYIVSYPSVLFSIIIAFIIMIVYYHYQSVFNTNYPKDNYLHMILRMIPSFAYSFIVIPLNIIYKIFATILTEWGL